MSAIHFPEFLIDIRIEFASVYCRSVARLADLRVGDFDDASRPSGSMQVSAV